MEDNWKAPNKWVYCPKCKQYKDRFYITTKQIYPCVSGPLNGSESEDNEVVREMGYELFNPSYSGRCILVYTKDIINE